MDTDAACFGAMPELLPLLLVLKNACLTLGHARIVRSRLAFDWLRLCMHPMCLLTLPAACLLLLCLELALTSFSLLAGQQPALGRELWQLSLWLTLYCA